MRYSRLYLLVIIFFFSFNTMVLAENSEAISSEYKEDIEHQDKLEVLDKENKEVGDRFEDKVYKGKGERINFFYLLGSAGYNVENDKYGLYTYNGSVGYSVIMPSNSNYHGFAINVVGGWQARKYFAMELAFGYSESISRSIGFKYSLLIQPYIKLDKSWSIMPKIGLGISGDGVVGIADKDHSLSGSTISNLDNFKVGFFGVFGLRANYNKFIFGLSYENTLFGMVNEFRILTEAGIKF